MARRKRFGWFSGGTAPWIATVIVASALPAGDGDAFHSKHLPHAYAERSDAKATFSDIIAFVKRNGWSADLGRTCVALGLGSRNPYCRFKQFAVQVGEGALDNHGFDVPSDTAEPVSHVVMFHLRPVVGEFFVVSPTGQLLATFYRAQGVDYTPISSDYSRNAFESESSFWQTYLGKFERDFERGSRPATPRPGMQP